MDKLEKKSEEISKQIEELILATNDPSDKALLLVLNKIATNLDENTALTRTLTSDLQAHTKAFQEHEKTEMALINQGRGAIRVALVALAVFQGIVAWYGRQVVEEFREVKEQVLSNTQEIAIHKEHHRQEERFKDGPKVK